MWIQQFETPPPGYKSSIINETISGTTLIMQYLSFIRPQFFNLINSELSEFKMSSRPIHHVKEITHQVAVWRAVSRQYSRQARSKQRPAMTPQRLFSSGHFLCHMKGNKWKKCEECVTCMKVFFLFIFSDPNLIENKIVARKSITLLQL